MSINLSGGNIYFYLLILAILSISGARKLRVRTLGEVTKYTLPAEGEIVDIESNTSNDGTTATIDYPIISYSVDGKKYVEKVDMPDIPIEHDYYVKGEIIDILVDPHNPATFILKDQYSKIRSGYKLLMTLGIVLIAIVVVRIAVSIIKSIN